MSAARKRWECPAGQHPAVLAPQRLRRKDIRRYCLPCSMAGGMLVERVVPTLEKKRAEKAARGREERKALAAKAREKRDAQLERFASYCGPAAVAKVLGVQKTTAARRLADVIGHIPRGPVYIRDVVEALRRGGVAVRLEWPAQRLTLAQWRRANRGANAVVSAGRHLHVLKSGRLVEDNGRTKSRAIVKKVIWLNPA